MITFFIFLGYFIVMYFIVMLITFLIFSLIKDLNKKNINDVKKDTKYLDERFVPIQKYNKLKERLELIDQYLRKNRNFSINEIEELNKKGKL
jgi:ABC-type bacteriocin/lantibiotic exporter with double-glycine peptidase domain